MLRRKQRNRRAIMADYQQTEVVGTKWKRACRINIENPLNAAPSVLFAEEEVINLGEGTEPVKQLVSNLNIAFNPSDTFPLRNPETGEIIEGQIRDANPTVYAVVLCLLALRIGARCATATNYRARCSRKPAPIMGWNRKVESVDARVTPDRLTASQFAWRCCDAGAYPPPPPKRGEQYGPDLVCCLCGGDTGGIGWPRKLRYPIFQHRHPLHEMHFQPIGLSGLRGHNAKRWLGAVCPSASWPRIKDCV